MPNQREHRLKIADTSAALQGFANDMKTKLLVPAVGAACMPIVVAAKRNAKRSERTGALRNAITHKVVGYPAAGIAVGLVGPASNYYRGGKKIGRGESAKGADNPSRIAHLVEGGHWAVAPEKGKTLRKKTARLAATPGRRWVPAKPFLRPAAVTTTAAQSDAFFRSLDKSITTSRSRAIAAGTHAA